MQQLFGSVAFGLLIGTLVSLSASPVVAAVLVPLAALLQSVTLRSRKDEGREIKVELGFLGVFSIACLVALLERIWDFMIQESSTVVASAKPMDAKTGNAATALRSPYIASLHAGEIRPATLDPASYTNLYDVLTAWQGDQPFWEQFAREVRTVYERCPNAEEPLRAMLNHVYQNTGK